MPSRLNIKTILEITRGKEYKTNDQQEREWLNRWGRLVLLRFGHKPTVEGIKKSELFKQPLIQLHVFELDQHRLPHEIAFYTSPRLWPKNYMDAQNTNPLDLNIL